MVLFLRNNRFNVKLILADYQLRSACRKTHLGGGDYYLRNSGLPPPSFDLSYDFKLSNKYWAVYATTNSHSKLIERD